MFSNYFPFSKNRNSCITQLFLKQSNLSHLIHTVFWRFKNKIIIPRSSRRIEGYGDSDKKFEPFNPSILRDERIKKFSQEPKIQPFKCNISRLISITFLVFSTLPLSAMDMDLEDPTEETPLVPKQIAMSEETPFFNKTRRFYDIESYRSVRNAAIKKCLCTTILNTAACGCLGAFLGIPLCGTLMGLGVAKGICLKGTCGVLSEAAIACCCGMCTVGCPSIGITEGCRATSNCVDDPNQLDWKTMLEITPEMIDAAQNEKTIVFRKADLLALLDQSSSQTCLSRDDYSWPWLSRWISCNYRSERNIIEQIKCRVIANQTDNSTISEKELLYVIRDLTNNDPQNPPHAIVQTYANQALLAAHGWVAFKESEKYPFKCEMKYVDQRSIPQDAKKWYCNEHGQRMYLPIPEIKMIRYYQFRQDPDYQRE
jgi:hypothetical protein